MIPTEALQRDAGRYRQFDLQGRVNVLERADVLPASLDGHVAGYRRHDPPRLDSLGRQPVAALGRKPPVD